MSDFVQIKRADGNIDFVNRDLVARVEAEEVTPGNWLVKVLMSYGSEVLDLRTQSKDEAVARVTDLVGKAPA
jgi:hypothetical protein